MTNGQRQDASVYLERDMEAPEIVAAAGGTACVLSMRCPDKPTPNEDAAAIIPYGVDAAVLIVADGLGGASQGEKASRLAIESLRREIAAAAENGLQLRTAIIDGIERANAAVKELGVGAATTLAAVEISGRTIRPYHVGDSIILVAGGRGKIKLQTVSHSPVAYGVEAGLIDQSEAMHHEDRHLVSNFVGTAEMRIDIGPPLELSARDTLLIASDGLVDNLHLAEIIDRIRKGPLELSTAQLAAGSRERMLQQQDGQPSKPDDLTLIAFRCR
jgi:serine/threonine protein phosphatase PrpC